MKTGKERRQRSDKKWSVQPTVSKELKDCIYRLSYITDTPVKSVIEEVCLSGIENNKVINHLSSNFRRDIRINYTLYIGDLNRIPIKKRTSPGQSERIATRVSGNMHEQFKALAYSLDCSIARACALLLDATVRDAEFINDFVEGYLKNNVDAERMKELRKVLKYVRANNPYDEEISWSALLSHLIEEVRSGAEKVQDTVSDFIIHKWK